MPKRRRRVSIRKLHELFRYEESDGRLYRRIRSGNAAAGTATGHRDSWGAVQVSVKGRLYLAHRVIWAMKTGKWPRKTIDHRDRNPENNRWGNLREATRAQQTANKIHTKGNSSSRGLHWRGERQAWQVMLAGKHLGQFRDKSEAMRVFDDAAKKRWGEFYPGGVNQ